jgi:hypothetical protein
MKPHFAPSSILLAAACACQVAAGQFANGQATSGGQPALAATADSSQTPNQKWPLVLNIARYANFFGWLGAEDGRIQRQTREGRQQIAPRIDYSSAIAIRSDEEEAMLALVLDADRRRAENEKKWKEADDAFIIAQQRGTDQELGLTRPDHQAVLNANWAILMGTWIKLKQLLGDEDFKKLDDYVNREFATTRYPASVYPPKIEVRAPVATIDKYELLIDHVTYEDRRVQRAVQAGNELQTHRENYSLAARFPQNEEEPTLAILRDARLRLNEKDEQIKAIGQEFAQKYGPRYSFKKQ